MNSMVKYLFLSFFMVSVTACSSSSSGGGDSNSSNSNQVLEARIDSGNAEQLGTAATEAAKQAVQNQTATALGFRSSGKPSIDTISSDLSKSFAGRIANAPAPFTCVNGSVVEVTNPDGSATVTFTMCDVGFGLVLDGIVNASSSVSGNTTTVDLEYIDFTISFGPDVITIDMEASCITDNTTMETNCTFPNVVGFDGRIYTFSEVTVLGDDFSGYTVSATIVDPDHGSFSIVTTNPILFGCVNEQPISGEIQFTDGAGVVVTVTFNDCASFTVSYSGTSEIYFW